MTKEEFKELMLKYNIDNHEDLVSMLDEYIDVAFYVKIECIDEDNNKIILPLKETILEEVHEMEDLYNILKYIIKEWK